MRLSPKDWSLSMLISKRARGEKEDASLRSMLVHRLRPAEKAVLRVPLKTHLGVSTKHSIFCESCSAWFSVEGDGDEYRCDGCDGVFVMEFAVFTRLPDSHQLVGELEKNFPA